MNTSHYSPAISPTRSACSDDSSYTGISETDTTSPTTPAQATGKQPEQPVDNMPGFIQDRLQQMANTLQVSHSRLDQLTQLLHEMQSIDCFSEEEVHAVMERIDECSQVCTHQERSLGVKQELYTKHVRHIEQLLETRRGFLRGYDELLVSEERIGAVVVNRQREIEIKLDELYAAIETE